MIPTQLADTIARSDPTGTNSTEGNNASNAASRILGQSSSNGPHAAPISWQHFSDSSVSTYEMGDAFATRQQCNLMAIAIAGVAQVPGVLAGAHGDGLRSLALRVPVAERQRQGSQSSHLRQKHRRRILPPHTSRPHCADLGSLAKVCYADGLRNRRRP